MSMEWPKKVNVSCQLKDVTAKAAERENVQWKDWYCAPKATDEKAAQAARIAALEASVRSDRPAAAPLMNAPAFPVLGGAKGAPKGKVLCWGCNYSTMRESKAVTFRPLMNLDLLPFDDGIGCGQYHNHGTCNCSGSKSR